MNLDFNAQTLPKMLTTPHPFGDLEADSLLLIRLLATGMVPISEAFGYQRKTSVTMRIRDVDRIFRVPQTRAVFTKNAFLELITDVELHTDWMLQAPEVEKHKTALAAAMTHYAWYVSDVSSEAFNAVENAFFANAFHFIGDYLENRPEHLGSDVSHWIYIQSLPLLNRLTVEWCSELANGFVYSGYHKGNHG
jgi:hypothetical protein